MEPWQIIAAQKAIAYAQLRALGMQAENDRRRLNGIEPCYGEADFGAIAEEMSADVDHAINPPALRG